MQRSHSTYPKRGAAGYVDPQEVGVQEVIVQPCLERVALCKVLLNPLHHAPNLWIEMEGGGIERREGVEKRDEGRYNEGGRRRGGKGKYGREEVVRMFHAPLAYLSPQEDSWIFSLQSCHLLDIRYCLDYAKRK